MKNIPVIVKVNSETYKVNGYNIYATKNPFNAWQVFNNGRFVADNLSLKEAKKQMIQIKNELIVSKVGD